MPKLAEKSICTGCTACKAVCPYSCIEMVADENGFVFPQINTANCIECGQCRQVCPVLKDSIAAETPSAYAAMSKDEKMRLDSSSGGIFTELAKEIISQGGVVYGAAYDNKFNVQHCCVEKIEDLQKLRGAKYAQSDLADTFSEIVHRLGQGQKVLFSGTPCQVGGLKALAGENENLFCIDFVCHSVPSPMAWQAYIQHRAETDAEGIFPVDVNLRSKETGWSKYRYSNVFKYENGVTHSATSSQSLFMKLFVGDYISRESCANCKFKGYSRVSDITLGDFWGIWDIASDMDDDNGTSVILVHSAKGRELWQGISERIVCKKVSLEEASLHNPSMLVSSKANPKREEAFNLIKAGNIEDCAKFFATPKSSVTDKIKNKIKRILKM